MYSLVCGSFSSDFQNSLETGETLFLEKNRVYKTYDEMISKESAKSEDQRMDIVSIVTPNHLHYDPAIKALDNGFPVIIDKPLTFDTNQAKKLVEKVNQTKLLFAVTHTYTGYPMVKEAKNIIESGKLGKIRKVAVEYPQGWLTTNLENTDNKQASWRTDPSKSGKAVVWEILEHMQQIWLNI